jgi:hypothetical protein
MLPSQNASLPAAAARDITGVVVERAEAKAEQGRAGSRRWLVLAARALLLLVALAAAVASAVIVIGDRSRRATATATHACPMHPEVAGGGPDSCPICGMALEPAVRADATGAARSDGTSVSLLSAAPGERHHRSIEAVKVVTLEGALQAPAVVATAGGGTEIVALMYRDEAAALTADEVGTFLPATGGAAAAVRPVRWAGGTPETRDASTVLVRFQLEPPRAGLPDGLVGRVRLAPRARRVLAVSLLSVFESPEGPYVLVASPDGRTFTRRRVELASSFPGFAVLVSGAQLDEPLLAMGSFLIDAERRLRASAETRP